MPMIEVALYQPEIPPNTGNIIRLCANSGAALHLIEPLGFRIDDASVNRAVLDYHEMVNVSVHASLAALRAARTQARWLALSTRSAQRYDHCTVRDGDILLFGPEQRGLPHELLYALPTGQRLKQPMRPNHRSQNL